MSLSLSFCSSLTSLILFTSPSIVLIHSLPNVDLCHAVLVLLHLISVLLFFSRAESHCLPFLLLLLSLRHSSLYSFYGSPSFSQTHVPVSLIHYFPVSYLTIFVLNQFIILFTHTSSSWFFSFPFPLLFTLLRSNFLSPIFCSALLRPPPDQ